MENNQAIRKFYKVTFALISAMLMFYLIYSNIAPFGVKMYYTNNDEKYSIKLSPPNRLSETIIDGEKLQKQVDDVIYFSTRMPFSFDKAKVKVTFKNPSQNQEIYLGFQDEEGWHYDTKLIDSPILNNLSWQKTGTDPILYQKYPVYSSFEQLLANPPEDKIVGTYNFDDNILRAKKIEGYSPSNKMTTINTPLRGRVVFYTYVDNELFKLWIKKIDLNLYEEPDPVVIKIYKESDVVYSATISDDGITDRSGKAMANQQIHIQNPGPGLPESGIYKVVIDSAKDSVITQIKTSMNKIVFAGPLYPVSNSEVYPSVVKETKANTFFSDALVISAMTYHKEATGSVKVNDQVLHLSKERQEVATVSSQHFSKITLEKSDAIVNGLLGNFAFEKDQFFKHSNFKVLPITAAADTEAADFIITHYKNSYKEGEWQVAEAEFDMNKAIINNGKLSWIIKSPNLKDNNSEILIKKIEVEMIKSPTMSINIL